MKKTKERSASSQIVYSIRDLLPVGLGINCANSVRIDGTRLSSRTVAVVGGADVEPAAEIDGAGTGGTDSGVPAQAASRRALTAPDVFNATDTDFDMRPLRHFLTLRGILDLSRATASYNFGVSLNGTARAAAVQDAEAGRAAGCPCGA